VAKKIGYALAIFVAAFALQWVVPASVEASNPVVVKVDGQRVYFQDQEPIIIDNRVLVPVRGVFEQMGFHVCWAIYTRATYLTSAENFIIIPDGASFIGIATGGVSSVSDVPPSLLRTQLINNRLMLPLRAVAEAVGASVYWDSVNRIANIVTPEPRNPDLLRPEIWNLTYLGHGNDIEYFVVQDGSIVSVIVAGNVMLTMGDVLAVWAELNSVRNVELIDYINIMEWAMHYYPSIWLTGRLVELTLSPEFMYYFEGEGGVLLAESLAHTATSIWRTMGGGRKQFNIVVSGEIIYSRNDFLHWLC